ncbi:hypothetical protein RM190_00560 [Paracoccus sp. CPCC 101403]|uniref:Tyr recombinase domain-containing protein n=1 Tax=Paracoccus broussonetiae TaxID=3075834 RepID=A0ABU3E7Z3_9RHOB|nr:hypothetical protein [Paracoccus sp. CPCC 101403]MDT1060324.1 hypothetical protein [Paracoccus sp. CPCC 101403]
MDAMLALALELGIRPSELGGWRWVEVAALFEHRAAMAERQDRRSPGNILDMPADQIVAAMGAKR